MARPLRQLTPESDALWAATLARYEANYVTVEELGQELGLSRATIFSRLSQARERREMYPDEDQNDLQWSAALVRSGVSEASTEPSSATPDSDRPGAEVDEAPWLALVDDPRDARRKATDFRRDNIHGETAYPSRPFYDIVKDKSSHEDVGGAVLVGSRNGASCVGGQTSHRMPSVRLEGQRLRRTRFSIGDKVETSGPTKHKKDPKGLKGGLGTSKKPKAEPRKLKGGIG